MNNMIPSVIAAMQVVDALAGHAPGLSQAALAKALGLSPSTTYRILRSLASQGWTAKSADGLYTLSTGLLPVLHACEKSLGRLDHACNALRTIAADKGIACKLSVRRGHEQVVIAREEPDGPVQTTGVVGAVGPITEGSSGAALLCDESDAAIEAVLRAAGTRQTPPAFLRAAIASIREKGWALRPSIPPWPISALSAPVRDASGAVLAALTFIVPTVSLDETAQAKLLLKTAAHCSGR